MSEERTLSIRVTGRVHGVWFRGWTQRKAQQLELRGWVRNEVDGSVSALISGPAQALEVMIASLHNGPEHARVDLVEVRASNDEVPEGFEVRC